MKLNYYLIQEKNWPEIALNKRGGAFQREICFNNMLLRF